MPKNYRKIPPHVTRALKSLHDSSIVVGCAIKVTSDELRKGGLKHLGINVDPDGLKHPTAYVPPVRQGKYSSQNRLGYDVVRRDLPLETRYNAVESPNWGDSYNGTHTVYLPYEAYPREHHPPRLTQLRIHCANTAAGQEEFALSFQVDEVLDRSSPSFEDDLLRAINLLQENVGAATVMAATSPLSDYVKSLSVSWEILPPGTKEEAVARIFRGRVPTAEERRDVEERYTFLMGLKPTKLVYGQTGLLRYFGALLMDDLVVFENIQYGNAVYIMFKDWATLSQRSRLELLSGRHGHDFERVPHVKQWKKKVLAIIAAYRKSRTPAGPPNPSLQRTRSARR